MSHFTGCLLQGLNEVMLWEVPGTSWRHGTLIKLILPLAFSESHNHSEIKTALADWQLTAQSDPWVCL